MSHCFATKWYLHSSSNPFPCFLPMTSLVDHPLCLKKCQTFLDSVCSCNYVPIVYTFLIFLFETLGLFMCALASNPGPFKKSEKRAWYSLFVHALNFLTFWEFRIIPFTCTLPYVYPYTADNGYLNTRPA